MRKSRFINQYECSKIYNKGKTRVLKYLVIKICLQKKDYSRFGIAVPKKNFKHATTRNKIRRQVRSILNDCSFKSGDYLLIVKKKYNLKNDFKNLKQEIFYFMKGE